MTREELKHEVDKISSRDTNKEMEDIRNEIFSYDSSFVEYTIEGHSDSDIEKIVENVINQFKDLVLDVVSNHIIHETRTIANMENSKINRQEYKEPTTKNDLGVDCISRADARSLVVKIGTKDILGMSGKAFQDLCKGIDNLPSVTPQEPILDKIKAEIKALSPEPTAYDVVDGNPVKDAIWETLIEVDKIIDKYKAESEGKE